MFEPALQVELEQRIKSNGTSVHKIAVEYAERLGVSVSTMYRHLKKARIYDSGKKPPSTKGIYRCGITDEELHLIIKRKTGTIRVSKSGNNIIRVDAKTTKNQCATWQAVEELYASGLIKKQYNEGTIARILREKGASLRQQRQPQPYTDMISLYPNHVWQYDTTWCKQVYLPDGGFELIDPEGEFYRNKLTLPKGGKMLFRFVIVDHFSSCFFVQYYPAEQALCFLDFFYQACAGNGDARLPLRCVPEILVTDQASEVKDAGSLKILDRLGVEYMPHFPKNSRAKGSVETTMGFWERVFESRLAFQPAETLEEINRWAQDRCAEVNSQRPLNRPGKTIISRSSMYVQNIQRDQMREIPDEEIYKQLGHKAKECTVRKNGLISFKGNEYRIGPEHYGKKALVEWSAYDYPDVQIHIEGEPLFKVSPVTFDEFGRRTDRAAVYGEEYKAQKQTATKKTLKAAATADLKDFRPFDEASDAGEKFIKPTGRKISVDVKHPGIRRDDAEMIIHAALGRAFSDEERAALDGLAETITEKDLAALIEQFRNTHRAQVIGSAG